ncbi:hypothetical protein [Streptomyces collinus]|uniref:hypothetical protein n=1 Tax=Streptomyces collinus TaxID=42684 RepID=UPI0036424A6D
MPETPPNSKGPAQRQISPELAASLGLTPTPEAMAPDGDLTVPISVRALPVHRANISNSRSFEESDAGVLLQWQLPETLAPESDSPEGGQTSFPLVPNRWLVARYQGPADARQAVGWVVQSDDLDIAGPDGARGTARSLPLHDSPTEPDGTGRKSALVVLRYVG